jgi:glycosyltransferase involved in cell wall biosynthesis
MKRLSVIIPTLNESLLLTNLLDSLKKQTRPPKEIIVADAGSTDDTVAVAQASGARVVPGGMPAVGRNAGARAAHGDILLFLDADVLPRPDFIALALPEFERKHYAVATCPTEALGDDLSDKFIMDATNLYLQLIMPISPRAPGCCIFARRKLHQAISGFDETLKMSEDHDYVRRATRYGKFGLLSGVSIPISMRRLRKEGVVGLAFKYLWCEMYALAGKPIRSLPFEYKFGAFQAETPQNGQPLIDIAELRALLGHFENPIQHISTAGLENMRRLAEFAPLDFAAKQFQELFERNDTELLEQYIKQRLGLNKYYRNLTNRLSKLTKPAHKKTQPADSSWMHLFKQTTTPADD